MAETTPNPDQNSEYRPEDHGMLDPNAPKHITAHDQSIHDTDKWNAQQVQLGLSSVTDTTAQPDAAHDLNPSTLEAIQANQASRTAFLGTKPPESTAGMMGQSNLDSYRDRARADYSDAIKRGTLKEADIAAAASLGDLTKLLRNLKKNPGA